MSRRYWVSLCLAGLLLIGGLALVGVTLGVNGFVGRQSPVLKAVEPCRSCGIFAQIAQTVSASLDSDSSRAFLSGLKPWRQSCEQERALCTILLAPADEAGHCRALREDWAGLETALALNLRDLSKEVASCKAMSCPVTSCDEVTTLKASLDRGSVAFRLFAAQGVPAHHGDAQAFTKAAALLGEGHKALTRLTASLAPDVFDFAGEWAFWQRFGDQLDSAGDELFTKGEIAQAEHDMFLAGGRSARALAIALEAQGSSDDLPESWQKLGDKFGAFVVASARIDELIAHTVMPVNAQACGLDVTDSASRLEAAMRGLSTNLSDCGVRAECAAGAPGDKLAETLLAQSTPLMTIVGAAAAKIGTPENTLTITDSPAPALTLEFPGYFTSEPMKIAIAARGNRCLARGASLAMSPAREDPSIPPVQQAFPGTDKKIVAMAAPDRAGDYVVALYPLGTTSQQGAVPLAQVPVNVAPASTQCDGFAGRWETDFGVMTAIVRGNQLRGTYRREGALRPGIVTGIIQGREMKGVWSSDLGEGGARLLLSPSGDRFSGTWGESPDEIDGAGLWRGQCATGDPKP